MGALRNTTSYGYTVCFCLGLLKLRGDWSADGYSMYG